MPEIAEQSDVNADILVDLRRIDFNMNLLSSRGISLECAGDAVVETHAKSE